ncbi:hypothetical protein A4G19_15370 [Pasteurellaceae bacterium Macca]|nr:hypothetical protein [Pasteurellaceae bacterium Macca]
MQWTNEIWLAIIAAAVVGFIVGYVLMRATNANAQKQQKLENELKETSEKLEQQKQQLEQHFEQSANLLSTLAEDYKKLYTHLAQGSQTLLPEENKIEFFQLKIENTAQAQNDEDQPKDYSEGSSGILKS